ncbi:hypothetical protein StoSoilB3_42260 (plasmid) [Arthrobacter sp. StoSoilB3]|nr:hypothetical protein StoSoilB3_42260 [Arthrobacter sp. StoSoilB3]
MQSGDEGYRPPYRTTRLALFLFGSIFLLAGLGVLYDGITDPRGLWLFAVPIICLWVAHVLRPPHAP